MRATKLWRGVCNYIQIWLYLPASISQILLYLPYCWHDIYQISINSVPKWQLRRLSIFCCFNSRRFIYYINARHVANYVIKNRPRGLIKQVTTITMHVNIAEFGCHSNYIFHPTSNPDIHFDIAKCNGTLQLFRSWVAKYHLITLVPLYFNVITLEDALRRPRALYFTHNVMPWIKATNNSHYICICGTNNIWQWTI